MGRPTVSEQLRGAKSAADLTADYRDAMKIFDMQLRLYAGDEKKKENIEASILRRTAEYEAALEEIKRSLGQGSNQKMERTPDERTAEAMDDLDMPANTFKASLDRVNDG